jgi:phage FluMu protein Com
MRLTCKSCNRYLGEAHGTVVATVKCKCGHENQIKYVTTDRTADIGYKFTKPEVLKG